MYAHLGVSRSRADHHAIQICNAGFVVPPSQRGHGYGTVLAHSFLHYAPRLGYQASVFNLVYVNNTASVRCVVR
jgi:GNAT superfamily N-acetyltransferase